MLPTDDDPYRRVGHHRLGGVPDLPPEFAWPVRTEEPFAGLAAFIGQIRLDALPAHGPLPRKGLLSIFCFGTDAAAVPCEVSVHLFPDCTNLEPREPDDEIADEGLRDLRPVAVELFEAIDVDWGALEADPTAGDALRGRLPELRARGRWAPEDAIGQVLGFAVDYDGFDLRLDVALTAAAKPHLRSWTHLRSMEELRQTIERLRGIELDPPPLRTLLGRHRAHRWAALQRDHADIVWWIEHRARLLAEARSWHSLLRVDSNDRMDLQINDADPLFVFAHARELEQGSFTSATGRVLQG